jgi:hypothetical protein
VALQSFKTIPKTNPYNIQRRSRRDCGGGDEVELMKKKIGEKTLAVVIE